jgi:hypothetical protein
MIVDIKYKIEVRVIVITAARKNIFLRWALQGFRRNNGQQKEVAKI